MYIHANIYIYKSETYLYTVLCSKSFLRPILLELLLALGFEDLFAENIHLTYLLGSYFVFHSSRETFLASVSSQANYRDMDTQLYSRESIHSKKQG